MIIKFFYHNLFIIIFKRTCENFKYKNKEKNYTNI